jgi:UDP-glucose 4-epimerase
VIEPLKYYQNNLIGLLNVLECMEAFDVNELVFSSSCTVYGEPDSIKEVTEETPKQLPTSPYGYTKWMAEQIIADYAKANSRFKVICLRYFNPIGAHPSGLIGELPIGKPNNLLPFITQTAIGKHSKLLVFGNDYPTIDGTCIRDYIHVMDLADAHIKAVEAFGNKSIASCEYINVGTGKGTSVLQMIQAFEEISGTKLPWEFAPRRVGDIIEIYANVDLAKSLLNWQAQFSYQDAIKDAWNWELSNKQKEH